MTTPDKSATPSLLAPSDRRRIVVLGYIIRMPLGGLVWHYLQFAEGLARMGHDVCYLEDSCFFEDDEQSWFYDPLTKSMGTDPTNGLSAAKDIFERAGLGDRWALFSAQSSQWVGPAQNNVAAFLATADIVLNISVANPLRGPLAQIPLRAFIDTDPLFSQVRILTNDIRRNLALQHNRFFTLGENIASGRSSVPSDGLSWQSVRQPIVLDKWQVTEGSRKSPFTTLMAWDSFPPEQYDGVSYGMKSDSFGDFVDLPAVSGERFEIGMFDPSKAPAMLTAKGWSVVDGKASAPDPRMFQKYVQDSKAEFSVAKQGYVTSRSGWFSDRSAAYLASGRPVLVQETGFSDWMTSGLGAVPFNNLAEATAGAQDIDARYELHCREARRLAEEYFDSRKVLQELIERAESPTIPAPP